MVFISLDKRQSKNYLFYTNLCINLVTVSWVMNIAFSLLITFKKIYDKIKSYIEGRKQVTPVTKMTEVKVITDKEI